MNPEFSFGHWVKAKRMTLDLTQRALADQIGCSLSAIQKIETDRRRPSRQVAKLLAEHLEIAPEEQSAFVHLARARSVDAQPVDNLPSPLTILIGREQETRTLCSTLLRDEVRLLTVSGPPGIGKSRLALEAAQLSRVRFSDGVCFVALASVNEARFIIPTIARALDISETERQPLVERLKAYLRTKRLLLLLDNFEHVLAGAPWVAELLESAPHLKVLVTSRALLRLYGEHEFVTPPLALPDLRHLPAPDALTDYAAIGLFVQRARAARNGFVLSEQNSFSVAELCTRLDGLPLAIELAASRSKYLSPATLLTRLVDAEENGAARFDLLDRGATDLPPRQQTLDNAIAWSYGLLTSTEQRIFRWLGVFAGGCTLEALSAVVGRRTAPEPERSSGAERWLHKVVRSLVNNNLVVRQSGRDGESRHFLLETIRAFALAQLMLSGEAPSAHQAHANYFLAMAEAIDAGSQTTPSTDKWRRLRVEDDNLQAALSWFLMHDEEAALSLAATLATYWNDEERYGATRDWLSRVLAKAKPTLSRRYARATSGLGISLCLQGDYAAAQYWFSESIQRWRRLGDERELGIAVQFLALVLYFRNEYEAALRPAEEAVVLLRGQEDRLWLATALNIMGLTHNAIGNLATARTVLDECLALFRQLGHDWGIALALLGLADIPYLKRDYVAASCNVEEALRLYRLLDERWFASQSLLLLGKIRWHQGERKQAIDCWQESISLGREVGAKEFVAGSLLLAGFAIQQKGITDQAQACFYESLAIYRQMEHSAGVGYTLAGLVGVMVRRQASIEHYVKAAYLLGAAAKLLASRRILLDDIERSHFAGIEAEVRSRIDTATFAAAWTDGERWTIDQCVGAIAEFDLPTNRTRSSNPYVQP